MFKALLTAALLTAALVHPVLAMDEMAMHDGAMMMIGPDGKETRTMTKGNKMKMMGDTMMKDGHVVKGPIILMMDGGKMYMMDDMKMDDGKMMSDHMMMK